MSSIKRRPANAVEKVDRDVYETIMDDMSVPGFDVYLTTACNFTCDHCFIPWEEWGVHWFDEDDLKDLVMASQDWGTEEITFLGGEPTLYPGLEEALRLAKHEAGVETRIVTNGSERFQQAFQDIDAGLFDLISFSLDGATPETHDTVRQEGSFETVMESIDTVSEQGVDFSIISSLYRDNTHEASDLVDLAEQKGSEELTVHFISELGRATPEMIIPPEKWLDTVEEIRERSQNVDVPVRVEDTYGRKADLPQDPEDRTDSDVPPCIGQFLSNLMFYPDGRVFVCALFLDEPELNGFYWENGELRMNEDVCELDYFLSERMGCPAIELILSDDIVESGFEDEYYGKCIYEKSLAQTGEVISSHR